MSHHRDFLSEKSHGSLHCRDADTEAVICVSLQSFYNNWIFLRKTPKQCGGTDSFITNPDANRPPHTDAPALRQTKPPLKAATLAKLHIHTSSPLPRLMSAYHDNFHRSYSADEQHDASAEQLFRDSQVYASHYATYPDPLWQPALPAGDYNITIDESAALAHTHGAELFDPTYATAQSTHATTSQQQWVPTPQQMPLPRRGSSGSSMDAGYSTMMPDYPSEPGFGYGGPYPVYPHGQHISAAASTELLLSPSYGAQNVSPHTTPPLHLTPPTTPGGSQSFTASPSPDLNSPLLSFAQPKVEERAQSLYTHRDQLQFFKDALSLPAAGVPGPFVPQLMYKPHTNSDRRRYVEEVDLEAPIHFWVENPSECGIPLADALHSRVRRLLKRDETVFEGRGPSVSIRLEWPGYRQWSRQIPTKDFRSPPGPITRAKLAKNVAKCVQRFIQERQGQPMEDDADPRWRVGSGPNHIKLEDLVLVSIHHVSMGSWQPHLRLRRPLYRLLSLPAYPQLTVDRTGDAQLYLMREGSLGVAIVARQVLVFQASRNHTRGERMRGVFDVATFAPFGTEGVFIATQAPQARINAVDILTVFPPEDIERTTFGDGVLEVPQDALTEFYYLRDRTVERAEKIWVQAWAKA
ncbi:hypothetical protein MKEN_01441300 [Mycena kentingensis (nom. inval.)]|nr:hypothetical protein MKEN_01441300 [Mycena kentingensis (nom. inval.)]